MQLTPVALELETLALTRSSVLTTERPLAYHRPLTSDELNIEARVLTKGITSDKLVTEPTPETRRFRRTLLASLYVAVDMLDEAHDLVTPDSSAGSDAAYIHAMLHRREGPHVGELGLTGFQNARYWNGVLGAHPLFPEVAEEVSTMAAEGTVVVPQAVTSFVAHVSQSGWDPDQFVALCQTAVEAEKDDDTLAAFCADLQYREWRLLYERVLHTAAATA